MKPHLPDIWKKSVWLNENYKILNNQNPIGVGGIAEVYLVEELIDKKQYALKVQLSEEQDEFKEAINEIHTMLKLDHPHIVK